jgi:hypothetical protein
MVFTSSNTKVATISGKTINIVGAGTSTITASQAASGAFTSRSRSTQVRVSQGTPVLSEFAPQSISITQKTFTLIPPVSNSDGNWNFTSSNPNIASVVGSKVTFAAGGTVRIYATQGGTVNWRSASTSMLFTVLTIPPVIGTFGNISIMKDSVASINLVAPKSTSPGLWTYSSSNPAVASIDRNTVTPLAFGTTVITAKQAAVGDYAAATATMTLTVQGPIPTVGAFADTSANISLVPFVSFQPPTSTSTGAWSFTSSDPTVALISGHIATLLKPGTTIITGTQAPTDLYASPTPVSMTLTVLGTPTMGSWADISKVVKDPDFTLVPPTSTSPGSWTYTSSNSLVADVVGDVVKVKGAGETTITATQNATPIYTTASANLTIRVFGAIPTIGTLAAIEATLGSAPIALKPPASNSTGAWTYVSSNPKVASINGSSLVIVGVGTATISATQTPAGIYSQSNTVQATVTVKAKPTATPTPKPTATPIPTPKPTATPIPTPKPTSSATKPPVNATIKVSASGRVLNVVAIGVKALVFINGKPGKVGLNSVKPGTASVVITIDDKVVYRRVFTIK